MMRYVSGYANMSCVAFIILVNQNGSGGAD